MVPFGSSSETREQRRNRAYLKLIFDHPQEVVDTVVLKYCGFYPQCYDALVALQGHGTPGRRRARGGGNTAPEIVLIEPLGRAGSGLRQHSGTRRFASAMQEYERQKQGRVREAERFVQRFETRSCSVREFWNGEWGGSYEGFLQTQRELGVLRDELSDRRRYTERDEFGGGRYSLGRLRQTLSFMLRSSAGEWFNKWGELDLHRLSERDAVVSIGGVMKQGWSEMRIVAGQKRHVGEDHVSEGVLHDLMQRLFGGWEQVKVEEEKEEKEEEEEEEEDGVHEEIRRYVKRRDVEVVFYSNRAAVYLRKKTGKKRKGAGGEERWGRAAAGERARAGRRRWDTNWRER